MGKDNFQRMMKIIDEIFDTRHDPGQLQVNELGIARLKQMHPATLSEITDENGPCLWVLLIPTTRHLMRLFISGQLNEQELFDHTPAGVSYEAIYLCSATVLPEYRRKGLALSLCLKAIAEIRKSNRVTDLFVWPFTKAGEQLAEQVATKSGLPLSKKIIS